MSNRKLMLDDPAAYYWQLGAEQERERIIKLLEEFDDSNLWRQVEFNPDAYEGFNVRELIDMIKGEQK